MIIEQRPLYNTLPVGQDIIFTVSDSTIISTKYRVKFTAQIYVADESSNLGTNISQVATLKVTPNNKGVGIFSLQSILESYVEPQHEGVNYLQTSISQFKGVNYSLDNPHPIHLIDKYAVNKNNTRYFQVTFNIEYFDSATSTEKLSFLKPIASEIYLMYNGVLNYDDPLKLSKNNYGFNLDVPKLILNDFYGSLGKFISNAPIEQYARLEDYGTLSFFNFLNTSTNSFQVGTDNATNNMVDNIEISLYNSSGTLITSAFQIECVDINGGWQHITDFSSARLLYFGAFPANLDGWSTVWDTYKTQVSYYTIRAYDDQNTEISQLYKINIVNNDCKGFESIRLTWLNKYGTWDYYTFKKKSVKSLQTNRTSYTQQGGTWNKSTFQINGYKGGKKNFRVNTKQLITINTNFINDSEAVWFEDLINSTEVYLLNSFDSSVNDARSGITNKYVEPVTLTTSSYTRKTKANDKLIQYTFELEKTHNKRIQSV
tara:strand:- start:687 stop:2147 length:1461 start_codon:yes stop_codon:yes gene_type:complete